MGLKLDGTNSKIENSLITTISDDIATVQINTTILLTVGYPYDNDDTVNIIYTYSNGSQNLETTNIEKFKTNYDVTDTGTGLRWFLSFGKSKPINVTISISAGFPITIQNDTKINGNLICDGFNIGTLSKNSNIGTLNSNLIINEGTSNMDIQLPNINFSNNTISATKIALTLEKGHYSNKYYYWLTATLDYNYFYIFSIQYDGSTYSGLFYFDQDLSTSTEETVHLMNLNNSLGNGLTSSVPLYASSWTLPDNNKWSNKVGFRHSIKDVKDLSEASGYSLYKIPYHFNISGYSSLI